MDIKEFIKLLPFKVELISSAKTRLLSELQVGEIYRESDSKFNPYYYHLSCELQNDGRYFIQFPNFGYEGKIKKGPSPFTWRDKMPEVYTPSICRQLSGKNAGKVIWFPYLDAWQEYCTIESLKLDITTKGREKRTFLPDYLNNTFYK